MGISFNLVLEVWEFYTLVVYQLGKHCNNFIHMGGLLALVSNLIVVYQLDNKHPEWFISPLSKHPLALWFINPSTSTLSDLSTL